ncbi:unnamed protein product [Ixodes hexagonus]
MFFKSSNQIDQDRYNKFGNLFGAYEGGKPVLFVADPDLVKLVLVKDYPSFPNRRVIQLFDPILDNMMSVITVEKWKRIRLAASPAFSTGKLRKMNSLIDDCARKTSEHLKEAAEKGEELDVKQFYGNYALDVIARCAFATRLDSHTQETDEFVTKARQAFSGRITLRILLFLMFPGLFKLLKMKAFNSEIFVYFKNLCLKIIGNRKEKQIRQEDFLQLMMDAQDGSITTAAEIVTSTDEKLFDLESEIKTDTSLSGGVKVLTEDEAMAQCVLFLQAGNDTTSSVIAFTIYLLAVHPEIQAKLRQEADECFKQHGPQPSLDVVSKLKYLHGVLSETLRIFPPATRLERTCTSGYVLGDTGIKVPKGCVIVVPAYLMHHDPQYFPDPTKFDPDRFSEENIDSIRPYTYLPFGAGPRNCLGRRFALEAVKLCILHSLHSVEFVRTKNTLVSVASRVLLSLHGDMCGVKVKSIVSVVMYVYYREQYGRGHLIWLPTKLTALTSSINFRPPFHRMDQDRYNQFGKLFGVYEGGKPVLFVADPDMVKRVLVRDFALLPNRMETKFFDPILDNMMSITTAEKWRRIRPAASPAFSTGKLRKMNSLIDDCARKTSEHLREAAEKEEELDMKLFYGNYALDVIARCAFGTRLDWHTEQTNEFVKKAREAFSGKITLSLVLLLLFPGIYKLFKLKAFNSEVFLFFKNVCLKIIGNRKEKQNRQEDFLQLMMDAQNGSIAAANEIAASTDEKLFNLDSELKTDTSFVGGDRALTEDEAMAQCVLFFLAGQDTTSSVISYTIYLLALHHEIQAKLREEADECFKQHGPQPSLDIVSKLKYSHGVVSESLRMFPPATRLVRSTITEYVLGDTGIKVPKGCFVAVPINAMHHDPEYFSDPTKFDPDRFSDENIDSIRPYTYLPFGAGRRNCIGMRFALEAVKLSILHSVHSVEFVRTKNTMYNCITSAPADQEVNGRKMKFLGVPDWIILVVTALVLLYLYASKYRNYWRDQNVVHEKFSLIFGPASRMFFKPFHLMDQERYNQFGKIFGVYEGAKPVLFVADPELVKLVLVKDFPSLPNRRIIQFFDPLLDNMMSIIPVEKWRRIRPAASPAFSTGKLRKMNYLIDECARKTSEHLKETAEKEGELQDVKQFYGNYALDVIARCAFATQLDSHSQETNEFVKKARQAFSGKLTLPLFLLFLFPGIFKLLKIKAFNSDVFVYFKNLSLKIIGNRKEKQSRQEDFLQLMMDAQDGSIAATAEIVPSTDEKLFNLDSELKMDTSFAGGVKALTEDEAMAQCVLFFLAGQDTTSSVISYTTYLLALHPEMQAKLRKEADECFNQHGPQPSLDVVSKLKYLHGVVSESLRMFPPGVRIERTSPSDYVLGDTGIKVQKGCVVAVPIYAMHHDPEYFPDPEKFDPDRFSDENIDSIRPYTYLPFGAGPRNCIGMRFALEAVKLSILHSVHSVEFFRTKNTQVPLEFVTGFGVLNAKNITVGVRKRSG